MKSGVRKSGWPMPRLMMSRPCAARCMARASTVKAFSSPMRSKAATVLSIGISPGILPGNSAETPPQCKPVRRHGEPVKQKPRTLRPGLLGTARDHRDKERSVGRRAVVAAVLFELQPHIRIRIRALVTAARDD